MVDALASDRSDQPFSEAGRQWHRPPLRRRILANIFRRKRNRTSSGGFPVGLAFEDASAGRPHSMETILVKIFATALALSQVTTTPDAVKTQFDRTRDQEQVVQFLRAGCTHMRKAFDIEDINLDDLIATALDDPQAVASENKLFRGIDFAKLQI